MKEIRIPKDVLRLMEKLMEHGFEAYAVGGCVRDSLLGREPEDWDITTSATPLEVKSIFRRTVDTGIVHGTVTVMIKNQGYEVTTYRVDGAYEDGRHPASVEFTASLPEDLKRRDFTINAMALSCEARLVDPFGGAADLERKVIRCVGSPYERFTEDALRILRAIRFSAQLDFTIGEETQEALRAIAPNLLKVSRERVAAELNKILVSENPEKLGLIYEAGIAPCICPDIAGAAVWTKEGLAGLRQLMPVKYLRWAGFLRRAEGGQAAGILRALKMDGETLDRVRILVSNWRTEIAAEKPAVRRVMHRLPKELFDDLLRLQEVFAYELPKGYGERIGRVKELAGQIRAAGDPVTRKELAVTGRDLMAAGMKPGPELGRTLDRLMELVIERPESNTREFLLSVIEK